MKFYQIDDKLCKQYC